MQVEAGSFRDRDNQIIYHDGEVYRGLSPRAAQNFADLSTRPFFQTLVKSGKVIGTEPASDTAVRAAGITGWDAVLHHQRVPFVSYPYEWPFGMLRDAALLHLDILEKIIPQKWILKDATAYNVQFMGHKPTFIDTTSFEPLAEGAPWFAYGQFCRSLLYPLMLKAYKDINYIPLLRGNLEGIEPIEARKFFSMKDAGRKGVLMHVLTHAKMQQRAMAAEAAGKSAGAGPARRHSEAMLMGTVQGLQRVVAALETPQQKSVWSHYDTSHSYDEANFREKEAFVRKHAGARRWKRVWDIGCNTGTFSKICSPQADGVVAMDFDATAVDFLYSRLKSDKFDNILPLVMNVANVSPAQGWRGQERKALEQRGTPELLLCLALIHHVVISANIPMRSFIEWIRSLNTAAVIEFVTPQDEMTQQILKGRVNQYDDYTEDNFRSIVSEMFTIKDSAPLKGGLRRIFYIEPA